VKSKKGTAKRKKTVGGVEKPGRWQKVLKGVGRIAQMRKTEKSPGRKRKGKREKKKKEKANAEEGLPKETKRGAKIEYLAGVEPQTKKRWSGAHKKRSVRRGT